MISELIFDVCVKPLVKKGTAMQLESNGLHGKHFLLFRLI